MPNILVRRVQLASTRIPTIEIICERFGYTDNADRNAALVIKKRAIKLILNTETVLSNKGVLDKGRGVAGKTQGEVSLSAGDDESSKKKRTASKLSLIA